MTLTATEAVQKPALASDPAAAGRRPYLNCTNRQIRSNSSNAGEV